MHAVLLKFDIISVMDKEVPTGKSSEFYFKHQTFPTLIVRQTFARLEVLHFENFTTKERHDVLKNKTLDPAWSIIPIIHDDKATTITLFHQNDMIRSKSSFEYDEAMKQFRKDNHALYNSKATALANYLDTAFEHCIIGNCAFVLDEANDALQKMILRATIRC
jgi:hypothetical protein